MEEMLYNIFKTANAEDFFDLIKIISDKVLSKKVKPPAARMSYKQANYVNKLQKPIQNHLAQTSKMVSIAEIVNDQKLVTAILEHFRYLTGF